MKLRILHIDTDTRFQRQIQSLLTADGVEVTSVSSALESVDKILNGGFNLVICDTDLSDQTANELLSSIRVTADISPSQLPFIYVYEQLSEADRLEAMYYGVEHFIPKSKLSRLADHALAASLQSACIEKPRLH